MKKVCLLYIEMFLIILTIFSIGEETFSILASTDSSSTDFSSITYGGISTTDTYSSKLWGLDMIDIEDAWEIETGSSSVKVGIIDVGVDYDHEDLYGQVNTTLSKTFLTSGADALDPEYSYHGTFIAGIIGAKVNNGLGVAGVCQNVDIVSLQFAETGNTGDTNTVVDAINYANENDIDILNMSLAIPSTSPPVNFYTAVEAYDGLIICCAGNSNKDITNGSVYPAAYNASLDNIIVVGGVDHNYNKVSTSNYSSTLVDVMAPGKDIISTNLNDEYVSDAGTSFATAYVTGIAALLKSYDDTLTPAQIKEYIVDNVVVYDNLADYCSSSGVVNAYNSLNALQNNVHKHSYSYQYTSAYGHTLTCSCGLTSGSLVAHTVNASSIVNNRAYCLGCKYYLNLATDFALVEYSINTNGISEVVYLSYDEYKRFWGIML